MNVIELNRALRQLRLGGMAAVLETRLHPNQAEPMPPIEFLPGLVADELQHRGDRLLERRKKQAAFRDPHKSQDNFDFDFNKKMNRSLVFDLAGGAFIARHEDALLLGPPGTGKSHLAQAIGQPRFSRDIACCIARLTNCSRSLPKPPSRGHAKSLWNCSPQCLCSSSMIQACANCPPPQPRTYSSSSCAAMSEPVPC